MAALPTDSATALEPEKEGVEDGEGEDSEGTGESLGPGDNDDSSEEEEEDSDAERRVREGFIVEDEEGDRLKRKKHKRRHRRGGGNGSDVGELDEDDLDLLETNTGRPLQGRQRKKLKRHQSPSRQASPGSDRIDEEDLDLGGVADDRDLPDIRRIFDDDRGTNLAERAMGEEDEFAGFIEPDEEEAVEQTRQTARRKPTSKAPQDQLTGIDREVWIEIQEIFGGGEDYAWAMEIPDEDDIKAKPSLGDIFEPTEISGRMLTHADEIIRNADVPERMQLDFRAFLRRNDGIETFLAPEEIGSAATWVSERISDQLNETYLDKDERGNDKALRKEFIEAVESVLRSLFVEMLEVPFIWVQRRDLLFYFNPQAEDPSLRTRAFLSRDDLWKVYSLGMKYRTILDRKAALRRRFDKLNVAEDPEFDMHLYAVSSVDEATDLLEWISMKYTGTDLQKRKAPNNDAYHRAKTSSIANFAKSVAMSAADLAKDFVDKQKRNFLDDPQENPEVYADEFALSGTAFPTAEEVLKGAKLVLTTEIEKEPSLRRELRKIFKQSAVVTVRPHDKGITVIDELHPYYSFKFLSNKPLPEFSNSAQFLEILAAEADDLVTVDIHLSTEKYDSLIEDLKRVYLSDYTSNVAVQWNEFRSSVIEDAVNDFLQAMSGWAKVYLKEEAQEHAGQKAATVLEDYIDVAPYRTNAMEPGQIPNVVAISHGNGDMKRDSLIAIVVDDEGSSRGELRLDNLRDPNNRESLQEFLQNEQPDVVVVGGFSHTTARVFNEVRLILEQVNRHLQEPPPGDWPDGETEPPNIEVVYTHDQTARLFQNSKRASSEFPIMAPLARYCVGLARYVQSPLHEFAALGSDLTALYYDTSQKYLETDQLMAWLERSLINTVNSIGVPINESVDDSYCALLLPYVAGMGPRKASATLSKIRQFGGTVLSRKALSLENDPLISPKVFENAASFLKFDYDLMKKLAPANLEDKTIGPDILDTTRIHPQDYEVSRKMAADALELDEEDLQDLNHPSDIVAQLMEGNTQKLDELSLDDFAIELKNIFGVSKRIILYMIRDELKKPFLDQRSEFKQPSESQVFFMLTGETREVLDLGLIIPVRVINNRRKDGGVSVRLDSGLEGIIPAGYLTDPQEDADPFAARARYQTGQVIQAMVTDIRHSDFYIELSAQPSTLAQGDLARRQTQTDEYFDNAQAIIDQGSREEKKKTGSGRARRLIEHPAFFNYNSGQAEQHLAGGQRGDCVIRPSSRGSDHLAVTWKVDEGVYQHLDILELDKPNESMLGRTLRVSGRYTYHDLDEIIVSHIRSLARKVDELMSSEKYKDSSADLQHHLTNFCMANPTKSAYGFAIDRDNAGSFILAFKASKAAPIQQWPVRIVPGAFVLPEQGDVSEAVLPDVVSLCNAFKTRYAAKQAMASGRGNFGGPDGRTPYLNSMTPAYGGRTPAAYGSYGGGRTPGYGGGRTPGYGGGRTPGYGGGSRTPAGWA